MKRILTHVAHLTTGSFVFIHPNSYNTLLYITYKLASPIWGGMPLCVCQPLTELSPFPPSPLCTFMKYINKVVQHIHMFRSNGDIFNLHRWKIHVFAFTFYLIRLCKKFISHLAWTHHYSVKHIFLWKRMKLCIQVLAEPVGIRGSTPLFARLDY